MCSEVDSSLCILGPPFMNGLPGSWMCLVVDGQELIHRQMGIFLSRGERCMAQHLLDGSQVCSFIKEMRRKRMSQRVGADGAAGQSTGVTGDDTGHASGRQPSPTGVTEQR